MSPSIINVIKKKQDNNTFESYEFKML